MKKKELQTLLIFYIDRNIISCHNNSYASKVTIKENHTAINCSWFLVLLLIVFIGLSGCSSTQVKPFNDRTYSLNNTITVGKGEIIARETRGEVESTRSWVGIMNSEDGWSNAELEFSNDFIDRKLIYLGFNTEGLHLLYREYKRGDLSASVNQTRIFNVNDNPFAQLGGFNIEVVGGDKAGNFNFKLLDEQDFKKKEQQFKVAKVQREKEQAFQSVLNTAKSAGEEATSAKAYAESLGDNSLDVYPQLDSIMNKAISIFNKAGESERDIDESIQLFQQAENHFNEANRYFKGAIAALESWRNLQEQLDMAHQAEIEERYLMPVLEVKDKGEKLLMAGSFDQADDLFSQATERIRSILSLLRTPLSSRYMN